MSSFEFNKIFAAVLVAAIVAMLSGFIAKQSVHPTALTADAIAIEGASDSGHGAPAAEDKGPEPILALLAAADVEKGAKVSKACAACHSFEKGGPAKQGPNLWGIIGRDAGSVAGFAYSEGLSNFEGNWDYSHLNIFLTKPKKLISDTKMNFVGLKKPEERAAIIAWLRTLADSPAALPSEGDIAAEAAAHAPPAEETVAPEGEHAAPEGAAQNETAPHAGTESPGSSADQAAPENAAETSAAPLEEQEPAELAPPAPAPEQTQIPPQPQAH